MRGTQHACIASSGVRGPWAQFISRHEALHGVAEDQAPDNAVEPPEHSDDILEAEHAPEVVSDEEAEAERQYAADCPTSDEEPPIASPSKPDTVLYICQGLWSALHRPTETSEAEYAACNDFKVLQPRCGCKLRIFMPIWACDPANACTRKGCT